ncbi:MULTISPECIES: uroporphyrinogen-III synthase [Streptomyces]|uniref:uroporphyrinogen-III synthase n=1 Tax=Streptomyces TaxID=1883 RepID=UPI002248B247|nr:uroporphyrinogen-III synthase [Streptomyces sp. JHD 1]MCX2967769.1 uroporphyrinogen-III synthase [Streptomyces sp. JHD 1]
MGTPASSVPSAPPGPLTGFTVGVTAARRREELVAMLTRRGARVVQAPALRIIPLQDDAALRHATEACLAAPLDYVVATTGVGWRGWMSAADGWGRGGALVAACQGAAVLTRGPKATGAVRASGLTETHSPGSEATDELLAWLLSRPLAGRRVAVQEHGLPLTAFVAALRERGAEVVPVPVYRWAPPEDPGAFRRLVERTLRREVDALAFTSAPAVTAFLETAAAGGRYRHALEALSGDVLAACVGPVCARPLLDAGLPVVWPERGRLGALVRVLTQTLPPRGRRELRLAGRVLILQGSALLADGESRWLSSRGAALLRALAERPGRVRSRPDLLRRVWADTDADEHAVEAAVARLRAALGPHGRLIETVPKRGYRLAAS